jgi:hypothetical protein
LSIIECKRPGAEAPGLLTNGHERHGSDFFAVIFFDPFQYLGKW